MAGLGTFVRRLFLADDAGISVPAMDGVFKPDNRLEEAERLLFLPAIDNLVASPAGLFCSSGNTLFRIDLGDARSSPAAVAELGDGGQSMQGITAEQSAWLRTRVSEVPRTGNTILVTHQPNLSRAFPDWGPTVADGETVILRPDGKGGAAFVGRISIEEWPRLR